MREHGLWPTHTASTERLAGRGEFLSVGDRIGRAGIKPVPDVSETKAGAFLCALLTVYNAVIGLLDPDSILETEAEAA